MGAIIFIKDFFIEVVDKIVLKKEVFNALSSETRLEILKKLDERRKTVTELAKELNCNKSAVYKHLQKLIDAGLIQKEEDERKWVYYSLTFMGKNLLHPEKIDLILLLSSAISFIAGIFMIYYARIKQTAGIMEHKKEIPIVGIFFILLSLITLFMFFFIKKKRENMIVEGEV